MISNGFILLQMHLYTLQCFQMISNGSKTLAIFWTIFILSFLNKIKQNQLNTELNKIKDFQVTCSYEELSPSEYALYINCELKVSFTRHSISRNLHVKYASRQPDDDGDRYSSSIDCDIDSNKKNDPIIKKILDIEDEDEDNWKYLITELNK